MAIRGPSVAPSPEQGMSEVSRIVQQIKPLTVSKAAAKGATRLTIWERESPGFGLRVTDRGVKTYIVKRRIKGQPQPVRITLTQTELDDARIEARRYIDMMRRNIDPRVVVEGEKAAKAEAARAAAQAAENTFAAVWKLYDTKHITTLKPRTQLEMRRPYRLHFEAPLGPRQIDTIRRGEISAILDGIAAPIAANRAYAIMRGFLGWCVRKGYLEADPCPREAPNAAGEARDRVLTEAELRTLWTADLPYPRGPYLKLLILTGQRRNEVAGMRWSEIRGNEWHIPKERTKAGRPHTVPLSDTALAVLKKLPRRSDYVLPASSTKAKGKEPTHIQDFSSIKAKIDEVAKIADWRIHDVRRSVATGLERLGIPYPVRAAILNHSKAGDEGVTAVYSRHDYGPEKRQALDAWAAHLDQLVKTAPRPRVSRPRTPDGPIKQAKTRTVYA
jgi:integrase